MNEQEKKTFKFLKDVYNLNFKSCTIENCDIKNIVNIIEKQSKEIEKIIQILEAKPYTAYTLYGEILHESDEIVQMLKDCMLDL